MRLLITAAFAAAVLFFNVAIADETATTHRAGDLVIYRFACHDAKDIIAIAKHGGANELAVVLVEQGKCFQNRACIAARLEAWISGPYRLEYGQGASGAPGSVWRVSDQYGDIEFVWINDQGGPHLSAKIAAF